MKIEIFTISDAATVHAGKLNILGTFDTIWAPAVPLVHPSCAISMKLRFEVTEHGNHTVRLALVDDDGAILNSVDGALDVQIQPGLGYLSVPLVFNIQPLQLPRYGDYEARMVIDNQEVAAAPLLVRQGPIPPQLLQG